MRLKYKWIFTLLIALSVQFSFGQEKTVTGVVSDASGTLPGANVVVQGTKTSTQTDVNGKYAIKTKVGDVLVFSFVNYTSATAKVGAANTYNAKLSEGVSLKDVTITTALGVKKSQKAVTYAAQAIKGDAMTEARESNIVNALSGKVAGANVTNSSGAVGASSRIVLRGASTITGDNQALFVVDGIPVDNSSEGRRGSSAANPGSAGSGGGRDLPNGVASISPDDIESVTVLKGPVAAALYGIRASKGVIVITTKSGKNKNGKFEISVNSNVTFSNPLLLPNYQNSYGQSGATDGTNYFQFTDGSGNVTSDGTDESWGLPLDVGLSFVQWNSYKVGGAPLPWVSHPDNVKDFFETGLNISNNITLSNGNENSSFRLSAGTSDETGMVPYTDFKKANIGINATTKLGERITIGTNLTYYNDRSNNLPIVGYNNSNVVQQFIWSARNVDFKELKDWRNLPLAAANTPAAGTPLNWNTAFQNNPYWVLEMNKNGYERDRIIGSASLNYKLTSNLSANTKISLDNYNQRETLSAQKKTNDRQDGYYAEINRRFSEVNTEALLTYQRSLTSDLNIALNLGTNNMARKITRISGELVGGLELPNLFTLSNAKSGTTPAIDSDSWTQKISSVFGFGQLSYKGYAFLDFTGRKDWANILPLKNNSFFYPSVSGSLVISDMLGFKDSKISYLKVRGGWSKVGGLGPLLEYTTNRTFDLSNNGFGTISNIPNTQFNPDIKPESTTGIEVGFDLNAFNNRLRFNTTYYNQKGTDLIIPIQVSSANGFTSRWDNAANLENKGFEVQLGVTALKTNDFSFDIDLNFAKNQNIVLDLGSSTAYTLGTQWGMELQAIPGQAYGSIVGFPYARNNEGKVIYENGLPKLNNKNLAILGNISPDWTGGANFTLKYKGIDLNTLIDVKMGGDVFSMTYLWGRYAGTLSESLIGRENGLVGDGVMDNGSGVYVPNNVLVDAKSFNQTAYDYSKFTEGGVFDASYVKLRQVMVGYNFPKKLLDGTFIQAVKFSVVARNLALLYKKAPHIDPESAFSNANGEQGQEFGQIPSAKTIGFNVNIKF